MKHRDGGRRTGLGCLELVVALSVLTITALAVGLTMNMGMVAARENRDDQQVNAMAQTLMDRVMALKFGNSFDAPPNAAQINALFNPKVKPIPVTLNQLATKAEGWKFTLQDFPVQGEWLVDVDKSFEKARTTADKKYGRFGDAIALFHQLMADKCKTREVLNIRIYFNGEQQLQASRANRKTSIGI